MTSSHIFFYGTLMRGFELRRRVLIDPFPQFVGRGTIRAILFDLGPYPAAIRGEGQVYGELFAMLDATTLLPRVDAVEGYMPSDALRSQCLRTVVSVQRVQRQELAWVYFYRASLLGSASWIPSGDYRQHVSREPGSEQTSGPPGNRRSLAGSVQTDR